jgi:dTMP kinase
LGRGDCVICDRFTDATYAYQGGGRGLDLATIAAAEHLVQPICNRRSRCCLDAPPLLALSRARARSQADRFEQEEMAFFERVRAAYLERARAFAERFVVVDASQDIATVHAAIRAALVARLP